jgi:branched-chain amino acid transport system permease protein
MIEFLHWLTLCGLYAATALGVALSFKAGGLLSLSYGATVAVATYGAALTLVKSHNFLFALLVGLLAGAAFGSLVGMLTWRLKGNAFTLVTLAVQLITVELLANGTRLTGGPYGLLAPANIIVGSEGLQAIGMAAIGLTIFALSATVYRRLFSGDFVLAVRAARDDEAAAMSRGLNPRPLRWIVAVVGGSLAGLMGAPIFVHYGFVDPWTFGLDESIAFLCVVMLSDRTSPSAIFAGTAAIVILPESLRVIGLTPQLAGNVRYILFGLVLLVLLRLRAGRE